MSAPVKPKNARDIKTYVSKSGLDLLRDPLLNKGSAFTLHERLRFGLNGLLPPKVTTIEEQARRITEELFSTAQPLTGLQKYRVLAALQDRNETLYYYVLQQNLEALMPVVYTPIVGEAVTAFSHIFRRGRGVFISSKDAGSIKHILARVHRSVHLIVATDGEAILGIGDHGANGVAISIGKLSLYTAAAGVEPAECLPVVLDVGTDNEALLSDPMYLGVRERRLRGDKYDAIVHEFVEAVKEVWPHALLQFEDFKAGTAAAVMQRYAHERTFNDDISGTGCVAAAVVSSYCTTTRAAVRNQRVVISGAGAAGFGISSQIKLTMIADGLSAAEAQAAVLVLDSRGLLVRGARDSPLTAMKHAQACERATADAFGWQATDGLLDVVRAFKPTVLIGCSGVPGSFTEAICASMTASEAAPGFRPLICPMSNPTSLCEALPADVVAWTKGACYIATGSPFEPVEYDGRKYYVAQANNAYIFPALGKSAVLCRAQRVTDGMFAAGARTLGDMCTAEERAKGLLLPPLSNIREVSRLVGNAIIDAAVKDNVSDIPSARMDGNMWEAVYTHYVLSG